LRHLEADIVGLQEVLPEQRADLETALPEYAFLGTGRDPGGLGEQCVLLYRREGPQPDDGGTFWLSPRPGQPGWDAALPRICTWARFGALSVFNTHLDHVGAEARLQGLRRILARAAPPTVLMGDLNDVAGSPPLLLLGQTLVDAWLDRNPEGRGGGTWHDFQGGEEGLRIDYIFVSPDLEVLECQVVRQGHPLPSDHYPLRARVRLPRA
jgi:endonuclease/exonuclease/phosphatase family metal-dependent hydrolase